jgi:hypothetical protein
VVPDPAPELRLPTSICVILPLQVGLWQFDEWIILLQAIDRSWVDCGVSLFAERA